MKLLRSLLFLLAVVAVILMFVFFFAGKGVFDDVLPLNQTKNSLLIKLGKEKIVDMGKYGIIVDKGEEGQQLFMELMLQRGYKISGMTSEGLELEKDGKKTVYAAKDFLFCKIYAPVDTTDAEKLIKNVQRSAQGQLALGEAPQ